ncbi:MAG: glycine cleavage system aminomethyltransferase GcvT [Alphaproteobacteria bacterium]
MADTKTENLQTTPLDALHRALGARMVPFAGYAMPVQYKLGVLKEHLHTRNSVGLFDVSHMGQAVVHGADGVAATLEKLCPGSLAELKAGRMRYSMLLNEQGGILDDLMVTRPASALPGFDAADQMMVVVNAACKDADFALIENALGEGQTLTILADRALLALQGPKAIDALTKLVPDVTSLTFMTADVFEWEGAPLFISRSGYTGEDGFEICVPNDKAEALANALLTDDLVEAIGLGARDSLRLEAGLPLYGHDIDETTNPIEAALTFAIGKRRKMDRDFRGEEEIMRDLFDGPIRKRIALLPEGRGIAREGSKILDQDGTEIGKVTSGTFSPSLERPIAMGLVDAEFSREGTALSIEVRGKPIAATVTPLPFVPHRYVRTAK